MSMINYSVGGYATANFSSGDAGAGDEENFSGSISGLINSKHAIENLHQSIMNLVHDETSDPGKKNDELRKAFMKFSGSMYMSKFTELLKPELEQEHVVRVLSTLSRNDFNPASRQHVESLAIDLSGRILDVSGQIYDYSAIEVKLHEVFERYLEIIPKLFESDRLLKESLDTFTFLETKINQFLNFETHDTSDDMILSFSNYLLKQFNNLDLKSRFNEFIFLYREFGSLRKVIGFRKIVDENYANPPCGICLNDTVSHALVPCGHTFCLGCATRQRLHCFICRSGIDSRLKLYFS